MDLTNTLKYFSNRDLKILELGPLDTGGTEYMVQDGLNQFCGTSIYEICWKHKQHISDVRKEVALEDGTYCWYHHY